MFDKENRKRKKPRKTSSSDPVDLSVLEKAPPHDIEAEKAVLGALLRQPELCDDVVMVLRDPDDFYHDAHKRIYSHLMKMRSDNSKIDLLLLVNNLTTTDELELIGGQYYLALLMETVPVSVHAVHYAQIVRDKATLRKLIHAGSEIVRDAYAPETQAKDILNSAASKMMLLCETQSVSQVTDMEELMAEVSALIDNRLKGVVAGVKSGFAGLDSLLGGFHPNELIILGARPSVGKTAVALNIAEHVALKNNETVYFVSLEMVKEELALRLVSARAKLNGQKVRNEPQFLSHEDIAKFMDACNEFKKAPLFIDDTPSRTVAEISAVARKLKRQNNLRLVIIDYIGLITPDKDIENRQEQVAKVARQLKLLARELKVPVLCLAQLNREADGEKGGRPKLSQLRESGAIEQDADVVIFVHRRDMWMTEEEIDAKEAKTQKNIRDRADLIVAKQRNGPTGDVELMFKREWSRFLELDKHREEGYEEFNEHAGSSADF